MDIADGRGDAIITCSVSLADTLVRLFSDLGNSLATNTPGIFPDPRFC